MYVPTHFKQDDTRALLGIIREYGFGLLILADEQGIEANHVPFHLLESDDSLGLLQCHLARGNPAWQRLGEGAKVMVVFQGPDAYVSPSWYPSKAEHGRVVPTWNYLAVHAEGTARVVDNGAWLGQHLRALARQHEAGREQPWAVDDAPPDYFDKLIRGIVGIEIQLQRLTGKLKASQNQPEPNRAGVMAGLAAEGQDAMARLI